MVYILLGKLYAAEHLWDKQCVGNAIADGFRFLNTLNSRVEIDTKTELGHFRGAPTTIWVRLGKETLFTSVVCRAFFLANYSRLMKKI